MNNLYNNFIPSSLNQHPYPSTPSVNIQGPSLLCYIGRIDCDYPDYLILKLLEQCGKVASWRRLTEEATQSLKSFGYCSFVGCDGVLRAMRILNNFEFGSKKLLVCNFILHYFTVNTFK
jgi:RNA recognition motif-containing protein